MGVGPKNLPLECHIFAYIMRAIKNTGISALWPVALQACIHQHGGMWLLNTHGGSTKLLWTNAA
jgi:hypothetical protein